MWSAWVDAYERIYNERGGEIVADRLKDIKAPVLIIHGDKDAMVDPVHPEHLLKNLPNAKLHRLTNTFRFHILILWNF